MNNKKCTEITKIPYFYLRNTIDQFPFIEETFDAVTTYQLLCKVVDYLNTVINQQNIVGEEMKNLIILFNELKEYVDNYLDSPEFIQHINDRINELVEDGTLASLINETLFNELNEKIDNKVDKNDWFVDVKDFGAVGDGVTLDRQSMQNAINYASENNVPYVIIRNGTFLIDFVDTPYPNTTYTYGRGLELKSNIKYIILNATIEAQPNSYGRYYLLLSDNQNNISIKGFNSTIKGERLDHTNNPNYPTGQNEQGHCIYITDSEYIEINGLKIINAWGDGICSNYSNFLNINNVTCDYNRRQGYSSVTGYNIVVENSTFSNTEGTAPQSGIDIEPDPTGDDSYNIQINNCNFINNKGAGLWITVNSYNIDVTGCLFDGNRFNTRIISVNNTPIPHDITIQRCIYRNGTDIGITIYGGDSITIKECEFNELSANRSIDTSSVLSTNVIVDNNIINGSQGINIKDGVISNNMINNVILATGAQALYTGSIMSLGANNIIIFNNKINNCTRGIYIGERSTGQENQKSIIYGNIINYTDTDVSSFGIGCNNSINALWYNNILSNPNGTATTRGIKTYLSSKVRLYYNVIMLPDGSLPYEKYQSTDYYRISDIGVIDEVSPI